MDSVFAVDETFSLAYGSRLVRSTLLTGVMRREHVDEQRRFDFLSCFLSLLGRSTS